MITESVHIIMIHTQSHRLPQPQAQPQGSQAQSQTLRIINEIIFYKFSLPAVTFGTKFILLQIQMS